MSLRQAFDAAYRGVTSSFRRKRRRQFLVQFPVASYPTLIDLGGLVDHWQKDGREVTVLNLMPQESDVVKVIVGDGRCTGLPSSGYDLGYSNSAIEHVGKREDQVAFANELRRVGRAIYCQTPNRRFPFEVHYLTALIHWYPPLLRNYFIARYLTLWGWLEKPDRKRVAEYADSVLLLNKRELQELFPDCKIMREKFLGLTKSLIAVRR